MPKIDFRGRVSPNAKRAGIQNETGTLKPLTLQSATVTEVVMIFINTSLAFGNGLGTSIIFRTSGGPYLVHTAAFIFS
jgi:hypothetical protein